MVISKISVTEHEGEVCNEICGYVNGEELRLFDPYGRVGTVQIGDVLSVNYNPDYEVIRTSLVASFSQGYCMTRNLNNSYMIGDLYKISDDVISLIDREGQINLMRIALQGHLYIYYPDEEAVEVKSISELREIANPADYIIVNSAYGAVNFVVMEKYR